MNPFDMMKNLQKVQDSMKTIQEKMGTMTVEGNAGAGLAKVTVNGHFQILSVSLAPECVDPRDIKMLEDLILSAANDAFVKMKEKIKEEMGQALPGGLAGFPGL